MPEQNASVLVDIKFFDHGAVTSALSHFFQNRQVINLSDEMSASQDLSTCRYAVLWKPDANLFQRAQNLDVLFSGGAGVDSVLALDGLPDVPLVRFVDPSLTRRMSEYVVLQCLYHARRMPDYAQQQRDRIWQQLPQMEAGDFTVGIMGLGELGRDAAQKLKVMGFNVIGWSRSVKDIDGVETFDANGLDQFLRKTDILVGLLPLTPSTTGIFNRELFWKLSRSGPLGKPVFINAGRGGSQVEADIVEALDEGALDGASLDVFEQEPLSKQSSLWSKKRALLTPHAASDTEVAALLAHVERQIKRYEKGKPLEHVVDRRTGY